MNSDSQIFMAMEKQRELLAEAQRERMVRAALRGRPRRPSLVQRGLAGLGRALVITGGWLEQAGGERAQVRPLKS